MNDNRLSKSRVDAFVNGDAQYNFGGWAPPILFPRGTGMMEIKGGCGIANKTINNLDFGLKVNGELYTDYTSISTSRISFCFPLLQPQPGESWEFEWVYPSGWYRCGNYWDKIVVVIGDFDGDFGSSLEWNAVYYYYRDGVVYETYNSSIRLYPYNFSNGCEYNVVFTPVGQNRADNIVPSPTPTPTPSSTPIP